MGEGDVEGDLEGLGLSGDVEGDLAVVVEPHRAGGVGAGLHGTDAQLLEADAAHGQDVALEPLGLLLRHGTFSFGTFGPMLGLRPSAFVRAWDRRLTIEAAALALEGLSIRAPSGLRGWARLCAPFQPLAASRQMRCLSRDSHQLLGLPRVPGPVVEGAAFIDVPSSPPTAWRTDLHLHRLPINHLDADILGFHRLHPWQRFSLAGSKHPRKFFAAKIFHPSRRILLFRETPVAITSFEPPREG